jgi:hypothetical protein
VGWEMCFFNGVCGGGVMVSGNEDCRND